MQKKFASRQRGGGVSSSAPVPKYATVVNDDFDNADYVIICFIADVPRFFFCLIFTFGNLYVDIVRFALIFFI